MKVHRITLLVVDHDDLGADEIREVIENQSYPNDCIGPSVLHTETRLVEWSDEHPLNNSRTKRQAMLELFGE